MFFLASNLNEFSSQPVIHTHHPHHVHSTLSENSSRVV